MKTMRTISPLLTACCLLLTAAPAAELTTATVDGGGGRSASANYTVIDSIGGVEGGPSEVSEAYMIVALWDFPDETANEFADDGISANNGVAVITTVGGTGAIGFTQVGASTRSAHATGWNDGAGTKAWQIAITTLGHYDLRVSSKQRSSNTGPRDFALEYSLNGDDWTTLTHVPPVADNFAAGVIHHQPLPSDADDRPVLFLRWLMTSNVSVNEGTVGSGGNSRIDDIVIEAGSSSETPSPLARSGYIGQLTEVAALSLHGDPASVNEGGTAQLGGMATLDDDTLAVVGGQEILWDAPDWPIASISAGGLATASIVYQDTPGPFTGSYQGIGGAGEILIIDSDPDNYGSYAGDGLPDWWQVQHFGFDNSDAAPGADPTETGLNNYFRYVAGLDPTDPDAVFTFNAEPDPDEPDRMRIQYGPIAEGRVYTVNYATSLVNLAWSPLTTMDTPQTNDTDVVVTDLEAGDAFKIYQLEITLP